MKVAKFGGSSLANANQIKKVVDIILSDSERRIIVVSAPGKRLKEDIKVTDLLIILADSILLEAPELAKALEWAETLEQAAELKLPKLEIFLHLREHIETIMFGIHGMILVTILKFLQSEILLK